MTQAPTSGPLSASDIAHVRDYWSAICDSDWHLIPANIRDDLEERFVSVGLAEWRAVTDDDLEGTFAYERGIEKGRSCLDLTALGHLAFKSDADGWMPWSGETRGPVDGAGVLCDFIMSDDREYLNQKPPRFWHLVSKWRPSLSPTTPVEASGFIATLTEGQRADALSYGGEDTHPQPSGETRDAVAEAKRELDRAEAQDHRTVSVRVGTMRSLLSARPLALGSQHSGGEVVSYRQWCMSDKPHQGGWWQLIEKHDGDHAIATGGGKNLRPLYDTAPARAEALSAAANEVRKLKPREERLGGQTFKYVKLSDVLDILEDRA